MTTGNLYFFIDGHESIDLFEEQWYENHEIRNSKNVILSGY